MVSLARIKSEMMDLKKMQGKKLKLAKEKYARPSRSRATRSCSTERRFAAGVIQGRTDGYKLGGAVPVEVLLGAGFHVAGLFDAGGDGVAHQMHNLGNGFLAAWASSVGWNVGRKWKGGKNPGGLKGIETGFASF